MKARASPRGALRTGATCSRGDALLEPDRRVWARLGFCASSSLKEARASPRGALRTGATCSEGDVVPDILPKAQLGFRAVLRFPDWKQGNDLGRAPDFE